MEFLVFYTINKLMMVTILHKKSNYKISQFYVLFYIDHFLWASKSFPLHSLLPTNTYNPSDTIDTCLITFNVLYISLGIASSIGRDRYRIIILTYSTCWSLQCLLTNRNRECDEFGSVCDHGWYGHGQDDARAGADPQ